jgi:hypothetical protein
MHDEKNTARTTTRPGVCFPVLTRRETRQAPFGHAFPGGLSPGGAQPTVTRTLGPLAIYGPPTLGGFVRFMSGNSLPHALGHGRQRHRLYGGPV